MSLTPHLSIARAVPRRAYTLSVEKNAESLSIKPVKFACVNTPIRSMTGKKTPSTKKNLRYIIMGAGMSGILAGVRLREAGENNFTIYDKGDRLGGTWRENRYPGLTCDVPAHAYTYSFAPNPDRENRTHRHPNERRHAARTRRDHVCNRIQGGPFHAPDESYGSQGH